MSPYALYDPPAVGMFVGEIRDLSWEHFENGRARWRFWVVDEKWQVSAPVAVSAPPSYRHCSPKSGFWAAWRQLDSSDPAEWEGRRICVTSTLAPSGDLYWRPHYTEGAK